MKALARKQKHPISLLSVAPTRNSRSDYELSPSALRESFRSWLEGVNPLSAIPSGLPVAKAPRLTSQDIMRVNHATIREGESHCVWPPMIVEKFKSAKVITDKKVQHYELKDASLRRVH
jgi:hypothetical protein